MERKFDQLPRSQSGSERVCRPFVAGRSAIAPGTIDCGFGSRFRREERPSILGMVVTGERSGSLDNRSVPGDAESSASTKENVLELPQAAHVALGNGGACFVQEF